MPVMSCHVIPRFTISECTLVLPASQYRISLANGWYTSAILCMCNCAGGGRGVIRGGGIFTIWTAAEQVNCTVMEKGQHWINIIQYS